MKYKKTIKTGNYNSLEMFNLETKYNKVSTVSLYRGMCLRCNFYTPFGVISLGVLHSYATKDIL